MPGAISLATTHPGKWISYSLPGVMKLVVQLKPVHWTLTRELLTSWYCAMQKVASTESEHLNAHHSLARPYHWGFHLSPELSWVLTVRPLQYRWTEVWYPLIISSTPLSDFSPWQSETLSISDANFRSIFIPCLSKCVTHYPCTGICRS